MPVLDHDVHPSVRVGAEHRYGCHDRRHHKDGYYAPNRIYNASGSYILERRWIAHSMSRECRYDMSLTDPACEGCQHRGSGEEYARTIRERGS